MLKTYDAKDIRNVLLVGHGGSGKTTLLEAMLFTSGAITRMGTVEDGNTVSDHDPDEQRKGISVSLSMAPIEWEGVKINVLDAPGLRRLRRRPALGDPRGRRRDRRRVRGRRRRGPDRGRVGARGRGRPAARDLREQARPRALVVPGRRSTSSCRRSATRWHRSSCRSAPSASSAASPTSCTRRPTATRAARSREEGEWPDELHAVADPAREKLMEAVAEADDDADREVPGGGHALRGGDRRSA